MNSLKTTIRPLAVLICLCFALYAGAKQPHITAKFTSVAVNQTCTVYDQSLSASNYTYLETHAPSTLGTGEKYWTNGASTWYDKWVKNRLVFTVEPEKSCIDKALTVSITVELKKYNWYSGSYTYQTENKTLTVNYDPSNVFSKKAVYEFPAGYKLVSRIVSITSSDASYNPILSLETEFEAERYFGFNHAADYPTGLAYDPTPLDEKSEYLITWNSMPWAEEYDLEWAFIDFHSDMLAKDVGLGLGSAEVLVPEASYLPADVFRFNSTRITTTSTFYNIPAVYGRGVIIYRVRGYGKSSEDQFTQKVPGIWSAEPVGSPTLLDFTYFETDGHEPQMNWQFATVFAEDGKNKVSLKYFDGSMRMRQEVSKMNTPILLWNEETEDYTRSVRNSIVSETFYDHQGRAAINVLPVPTDKEQLRFYDQFNRNPAGTGVYDKANFDIDRSACTIAADIMNTGYGASNYYSPDNIFLTTLAPPQINKTAEFIPDAQKYPFVHTQYVSDNTNKIYAKSGAGGDHQIGSGHETKYYYTRPFQEELDRLFGAEVGFAEHYKKNVTQDPNGQLSISYLDMQDKVIATSLIGPKPANVAKVETYKTSNETVEVDLLNKLREADNFGKAEEFKPNERTRVMTQEFFVADEGIRDFRYELINDRYTQQCDYPTLKTFCYNCVLDLKISVKDECGVQYLNGLSSGPVTTKHIDINDVVGTGVTTTNNCEGSPEVVTRGTSGTPWQSNTSGTPVAMHKGTYTLTKTLTVNQAALDIYTQNFIENNDCFKKKEQDLIDEEMGKIDTSFCTFDCSEWLERLGATWAASPLNPANSPGSEVTEEIYNTLFKRYTESCNEANRQCRAAYEMMLQDVSPLGQYGEIYTQQARYDANGKLLAPNYQTFSPQAHPLSVFNENNYLPWKNAINDDYKSIDPSIPGYWPSWRFPYNYNESNTDKRSNYLDQDGNIAYVYLERTGNEYSPRILGDDYSLIEFYQGKPRILVKYLADVKDLVNVWDPAWAKSLVVHHPEYMFYIDCISRVESNVFDDAWLNTQSVDDAVTAFNDGTHDWTYPLGLAWPADTPYIMDPFFHYAKNLDFANDPLNPTAMNATGNVFYNTFRYKLENFITPPALGYSLSMQQMAIILANCPDIDITSPNCGSTLYTCLGGRYIVSSPEEWRAYRQLYYSLKQRAIEALSIKKSIESGYYNGCVGEEVFNMSKNWFYNAYYNAPASPAVIPHPWFNMVHQYMNFWVPKIQFYNPEQPCNWARYWLYKNKNMRYRHGEAMYNVNMLKSNNAYFALKPDSVLNFGDDSTNYAILAEVKQVIMPESYKANCGQCPVAENMVQLLNSLKRDSKLISGSTYHEIKSACNTGTDYQEVTTDLEDRMFGADPYKYFYTVQYKGEQGTTGGGRNYLKTYFNRDWEKSVTYLFPAGSLYNASDIVRFCCIRGNTALSNKNAFDFKVTVFVKVKSSDPEYASIDPALITAREVSGNPILREITLDAESEFIDLIHCDNEPLCKPSAEASYMLNFLNGARDFSWYNTSNTNVQASVARDAGGSMIITQSWQQTFTDVLAKTLFPNTFNNYFDPYYWRSVLTSNTAEEVVDATFTYKLLTKQVKLTMKRDPANLSIYRFQQIRSLNSITPKLGYPNVAIIKATACDATNTVCKLVTIEMDLGFPVGDCSVGLPDRMKSGEPANNNKVKPDIGSFSDYGVVIHTSPADTTKTSVITVDSIPPGGSPCASAEMLKNYMLGKIKIAALHYDTGAWITEWNPCPFGHGWVARRYLPVIDTYTLPCSDCSFKIIFPGDGYEDENGNPMPYTMQNVVAMNEFRTISPGEYELDVTTNDGKKLTIRIRLQNCNLPDSVTNIIPGGPGGGPGGGDGDGKCRPTEVLNFHNFSVYYNSIPAWNPDPSPGAYDPEPGKKYYYDAYGKDFTTDLDTSRIYRFDTLTYPLQPGQYSIVTIPLSYRFLNYSNNESAMRYRNLNYDTWEKVWETAGNVSMDKDIGYTFSFWHKEILPYSGAPEASKVQIFFADTQASTIRTIYRIGDEMWVRYDVLLLSTYNRSGKIRIETKNTELRDCFLTGIQFLKDCGPTFCCPMPMPQMALKNPCHEQLEAIALENARIRYKEYLEPIITNFQQGYINQCLRVSEKFFMKYQDSEDHTTLYYYDQAGNLVRTVPPKGVVKISDPAKLARIREDRANGLRREFTDHEYKTTYTYNSLNQLQHQSMPDNDNMPIWNTAVKSGIIPAGYTIKDIRFTDKLNGILLANHSSAGGRIYKTSNGGDTWTEVNAFGLADLNSMVLDGFTGARYVVGGNGLIMQNINTGGTWKWNIRVLPTAEKLVKINLVSSEFNDDYTLINTRLWVHDEKGTGWLIRCAVNYPAMDLSEWNYEGPYTSLAGVATGKVKDVHIPVSFPYSTSSLIGYAVTENGKVYRTDDEGYTWSPDIANTSVANNLTALHFNAANQGYIGGENGLLLKGALVSGTVSQPARWRIVPGNLSTNISKVYFIDGDKGFVLGADYNLYRTTDAGVTFTDLNIPDDVADFIFGNNTTGAAVTRNGKVYRTTDAGITWTLYSQIMNGGSPFYTTGGTEAKRIRYTIGTSFSFMMVTGNANVHYSTVTNTTGTWSVLNVTTQFGANTISDLSLDQLSNSMRANFLLSNGNIKAYAAATNVWTDLYTGANATKMFFTTYNKGAIWCSASQQVKYYNSVTPAWETRLSGISGVNAFAYSPDFANLLIIGNSGSIQACEGAGATSLMNISSGIYMPKLNAVQCYTAYSAPTYAVAVSRSGLIMFGDKQIANNYTTWTVKKTATAADLNDVFYAGSQYTAAGNKGVAFTQSHNVVPATVTTATTTDYHAAINVNQVAGVNGIVYNLATSTAYTTPLTSSTISDGTGDYVIGENGYMAERVSTTYTAVNMVIPQKLNAVYFANASVGYAGGEAGSLWKTTDGGKSWKDIKIAALVGQNITGISFLSETNGFVVATGGKIYKTTNGETFTSVTSGTTSNLTAIDINANGLGYIVGQSGACIVTTDFGTTWTYSTISGSPNLNSVTVPDYNLGYACGDNSKLYKLVPGSPATLLEQSVGTSWPSFLVSAQRDLTDIHFIDRKTGYVTGATGFLMKTVDGGTIWKLEQSATTDRINAFAQADEVTFYAGAQAGEVSKITDMKDRYSIKLYYDILGRIAVTQNTKQYSKVWPTTGVADHLYYSYTLYDFKGRVVEIGELHATTLMESNYNSSGVLDHGKFLAWVDASTRTQITRTFYDVSEFSSKLPITFVQNNLRNRVASMAYYPVYSINNTAYQSASHYSYDIHGNVSSLLQENTTLADIGHAFKRIDYTYDLISNKIMEIAYQHGYPDRFYHRYNYNGDNRATLIETSYDKVVWEKDVKYQYYLHGLASRIELGNDQVQGLDYAYTMQGWIKAVNGASLDVDAQNTMGNDGVIDPDNANSYFGKDEMAYELNYYNNDYAPVSGSVTAFANVSGSNYAANLTSAQLYNGNISGMITSHRYFIAQGKNPLATTYSYDQLNRLRQASYHYTVGASTWLEMDDYRNIFNYDANGNITKQYRNGSDAEGLEMDDLTYQYYAGTNKLRRVDDAMGKALYTDDINDQLGANNPVTYNNYEYDELGNLVKDRAEEIEKIEWTVGGKIAKITRTSGSLKPDLEFIYDPSGNRIVKIVSPKTGEKLKVYTFYVRDAQGNVMSTYNRSYDKDVNYAALNFSIVNSAIISASTISAFTGFVNYLHAYNNNSNAAFFANLKGNIYGTPEIVEGGAPYFGGMINDLGLFDDSYAQLSDDEIMYLYAEGMGDPSQLESLLEELCNCYEYQHGADPGVPGFIQLFFDQTIPGIGNNSAREIFLTYLYEYDNNAFYDFASRFSFGTSYDFTTDLDNLLQAADQGEWEDAFSALSYDCRFISSVLAYGYYNSGTYPNTPLFGSMFAYLPNIKDALNPNASSCGISVPDAYNAGYFISQDPDVISYIVSQANGDMTDWLVDNAIYYMLGVIVNFDPYLISLSQQQTSGIYGGMEGYFNLIRTHFGETFYQKLKAQLSNSYPAYLDKFRVNEQYVYGTSRVGSYRPKNVLTQVKFTATLSSGNFSNIVIQNVTNMATPAGTYSVTRGQKQYELSNHLGNVLAVVSDRKTALCNADLLKFSATFDGGSTTGWSATYQSSFVYNGSEQINVKGPISTCQITSPMVTYTIGKQYRLSFDLLNNVAGNYLIVYTMWPHPNYTITWIGANGHYEIPFTAYATNMQVYFNYQNNNNTAAVTYSLDNVQIHEVNGAIGSYTAQVLQANDYSPFGAPLAGRSYDRAEEASRNILYSDQFTGSTNGWLPRNSITLTHDAGRLKCASSATWGTARKVLSVVNGKQYKIRFRIEMGTATALNLPLYNNAITSFVTMPDVGLTITQSGVYEGHFTANDNTMNFLFEVVPGNPTGATFWLDDVVVEEDVREEKAYAFGFNGKEADDEVKGDGNQQDYGMRVYDTRLGKFLSVDPLARSYAFYTPYQFAGNTPLSAIDLDGEEPKVIVTNKITGYTLQHVYGVQNVREIIVPTYEAKVVYTDASGKTTEMGTFNVTRDGWFSLGTAANGKAMLSNRSSDPSPKTKKITIERQSAQQYGDGTPSFTMSPIHSPLPKEDNTSYYDNGVAVKELNPEVKRTNDIAQGAQFHVGGVYDKKAGPGEEKALAGAYGCYGVVPSDQVYSSEAKVPEVAKMKGTSNQEMINFGAAIAAAEAMQMTEHGKPAKVEVDIQTRKYEQSKQVTAKP
jgi:RHS repeat-associated protein